MIERTTLQNEGRSNMGNELVDMNRYRVRSIERADLQTVVGLNNAEVPAVTTLDEARAAELVDMCAVALCVVDLGADTAVVLADGGDGGESGVAGAGYMDGSTATDAGVHSDSRGARLHDLT